MRLRALARRPPNRQTHRIQVVLRVPESFRGKYLVRVGVLNFEVNPVTCSRLSGCRRGKIWSISRITVQFGIADHRDSKLKRNPRPWDNLKDVLWDPFICGSTPSGLPCASGTRMNRLSDKKSKKSLKSHITLGIPINVAAGPLGFRTELDIGPKGEQGRPYHDLEGDGPDPAVALDENDTRASRVVFLENKSEDQRPPTPEALTPDAAVDGTEHGNGLTSEQS